MCDKENYFYIAIFCILMHVFAWMGNFMDQLDLNNPDTRQLILKDKLKNSAPLVAADIAAEFGISVDTVRRDLIALEQQGLLKRVKGGALPLLPPVKSLVQRMLYKSWLGNIAPQIERLLQNKHTIFMDGGTSVAEFARQLPHQYQGLVITPSPIIVTILLEAQIETLLIGGRIKPSGGIAIGAKTVQDIANCTADICILGACALDVEFGLGADDKDEADVKQQMAMSAGQTVILAEAEKLHQRARHKVIDCTQVDILITNAKVEKTIAFCDEKIEVIRIKG